MHKQMRLSLLWFAAVVLPFIILNSGLIILVKGVRDEDQAYQHFLTPCTKIYVFMCHLETWMTPIVSPSKMLSTE